MERNIDPKTSIRIQKTSIRIQKTTKHGNQSANVRTSIDGTENRLGKVTRRINSSSKISPRNKELVWKFVEHYKIQGLSTYSAFEGLNAVVQSVALRLVDTILG